MPNNYKYLAAILIFLPFLIHGQYNDAYFQKFGGLEISLNSSKGLQKILKQDGIILDHGSTLNKPKLYITFEGLTYLNNNNIDYQVVEKESVNLKVKTYDQIMQTKNLDDCFPPMDFYPSYQAYEQMMYDFESRYPSLCKIINIGTLSSGRKLLVAQIGDNIDVQECEPNFLYTSSMHGDELVGFPLMLNLIDSLLCSYGVNEDLTELVNNVNIYINPLANPDGAYRNNDATVDNAMRFNGKFVDLNRNYPDAKLGENPDGREYQEETVFFMEFAENYNINISCNIHGGVEVCNYPWDTFSHLAADDSWWEKVCRNYVDTVQSVSVPGYFNFQNNGITSGYAWFEANGARQDYMTYFHRGREFTLEISDIKLMDSDSLPTMWEYNKNSLINYMKEAQFGLSGKVINCQTGEALEANVFIEGHDFDNSDVYSNISDGSYFRYLDDGIYDISFIAEGFDTITRQVTIVDKSTTVLDIELCPIMTSNSNNYFAQGLDFKVIRNKVFVSGLEANNSYEAKIFTFDGKLLQKSKIVDTSIDLSFNFPSSIFYILVYNRNKSGGKLIYLDSNY